MKKLILLGILGLLASNLLLAENTAPVTNPEMEKTLQAGLGSVEKKALIIPKDPLIAGLLSVEFPGLGQIYCRRYLRGMAFLSSEIGCFVLATALLGVETKEYSWKAVNEETSEIRELIQKVQINKWDDLSGLERAGVVGLFMGGIGLHIWNVIDAYNVAQDHNQKLCWIRDVDLQIGLKDEGPFLKLQTKKKF